MLNNTVVRRLKKIFIVGAGEQNLNVGTAFIANAMKLGYFFDAPAIEKIMCATPQALDNILEDLKTLRGAQYTYEPMYPNFPKQVAQASDVELYTNAIFHYFGDILGVRIMPEYDKEARELFSDAVNYTQLGVASEEELRELFASIVASSQPFSVQDINDLEELRAYAVVSEPRISENLAIVSSMFADLDYSAYYKTVTDVLRYAVAVCGGDVSLSDNTKLKFSRAQRKNILDLLEAVLEKNPSVADFGLWAEQWKRLAFAVRAGDYANRFPRSFDALAKVTSNDLPRSFNALVEEAFEDKNFDKIVELLSTRPGMFARQLAHILRLFPERRSDILNAFGLVGDKVSVNVLVQAINHFKTADKNTIPFRAVQFKTARGSVRTELLESKLEGDYSDVVDVLLNAIYSRFDGSRKIFLTEDASRYAIPMGNRSASEASRQIARGSRISLSDVDKKKNTVRLFMHWRDIPVGYGRVDLDLSAQFVNADLSQTTAVWYGNLRGSCAVHSGDITSAPNGASEFIDIDIEKALDAGYRYVVPSVYSYSGQSFNNIPEALAGFMMRDKTQSGEIYEPASVDTAFTLDSTSRNALPFVFDLEKREFIWWDSTHRLDSYSFNNVHNNANVVRESLRHLVNTEPFSVAELAKLLGEVVDSEDEATMVIDPTSFASVSELVNL